MKTIMVPTDFSMPAENAAKYAVSLATTAKADVVVFNAFIVPAEAPRAAMVAWPLMDYDTMLLESTTELEHVIKRLQPLDATTGTFCPKISFKSCKGTVQEVTDELVKKAKIDLVIIGLSGAGAVSQVLLGSNCRSMIENATFPVLYIPFLANFKPIKTIAFATDLSLDVIPALKAMLDLLKPFSPVVRLIYITEKDISSETKNKVEVDDLIDEIRKEIQHTNIFYEYVWNIDIDNGLDWITEQPEIDMIAIVHHPKSLLGRLFKGSHTQKLSRVTKIPLLVLHQK